MPSLIEFSKGPSVRNPHYLSTMQEEPFPPAKGDDPPQFKDVVAQPTSFKFSLKCPRHGEPAFFQTLTRASWLTYDTDTKRFMKSLTGWKLKYMG